MTTLDDVRADVQADLVDEGFAAPDAAAAVKCSSVPVYATVYTEAVAWLRVGRAEKEKQPLPKTSAPVKRRKFPSQSTDLHPDSLEKDSKGDFVHASDAKLNSPARTKPFQVSEEVDERPLESALGIPPGYIVGLGRDYPHPRIAHIYRGTFSDPGLPMCARGWNRDGGQSYSIWRGHLGAKGVCSICWRRAKALMDGVPARTALRNEVERGI